jgi:hypothetical protein
MAGRLLRLLRLLRVPATRSDQQPRIDEEFGAQPTPVPATAWAFLNRKFCPACGALRGLGAACGRCGNTL